MNICINIYGQQRNLNNTINTINQIINEDHKFTILYTGWNNEETQFEKIFPTSYVRRIDKDNNIINKYLQKYSDIKSDITNKHKSIEHIIIGFYIKNQSIKTINQYLELNPGLKFDLIITIRTDTLIYNNKKINYNEINDLSKVYICKEIDFNIYNMNACNDVLVISNYEIMLKILDQINYLDKVTINNNQFHPETCFYKYLNNVSNFDLVRINLKVHGN
jgi:hypothetical protein